MTRRTTGRLLAVLAVLASVAMTGAFVIKVMLIMADADLTPASWPRYEETREYDV